MASVEQPIAAQKSMIPATTVIASTDTSDLPPHAFMADKLVTIASVGRRSVDQDYSPLSVQHLEPISEMPNLKPLMAMNLNRPYTGASC